MEFCLDHGIYVEICFYVLYSLFKCRSLTLTLQWHHNGCDGVSNHPPLDCLLNRLFTHRSKKIWKLRVTGLSEGNSPVTGEFPSQRARNAENVSVWWRHHGVEYRKQPKLIKCHVAIGVWLSASPQHCFSNNRLLDLPVVELQKSYDSVRRVYWCNERHNYHNCKSQFSFLHSSITVPTTAAIPWYLENENGGHRFVVFV